MKGKDLIKLIQDNNLEEFDVEFSFTDGGSTFPNIRSFELTGIADIGHSDKVVVLDGEEN